MRSGENAVSIYRIATILSCASIVVTAVYILRAVGQVIMGPVNNSQHLSLPDATWNEKFAAAILVIGIVMIGVAPFWLNDLINPSTQTIIEHTFNNMSFK